MTTKKLPPICFLADEREFFYSREKTSTEATLWICLPLNTVMAKE